MRVEKTQNLLTMTDDRMVVDLPVGMSPNQVIEETGLVFTRPFFLLVDGEPVLRGEWDGPLVPEARVCHFVELPRGPGGGGSNPGRILATLAVVVASIYTGGQAALAWGKLAGAVVSGVVMMGGMVLVNAFLPASVSSEQAQIAESAYSLTNNQNVFQLGSPFPEQFGRFICFPVLAQCTYTMFADNDGDDMAGGDGFDFLVDELYDVSFGNTSQVYNAPQYLFFLGIIGVGDYDVEGAYIDETPIDDYEDCEYNVLAPGESPQFVTKLCWVSREITGQELGVDWLTVVANPAGSAAVQVSFDIVFPGGMAYFDDEGGVQAIGTYVYAEVRQVDSAGDAIGDWEELMQEYFIAASVSSIRVTRTFSVPSGAGRYEFRIRRNRDTIESSRVSDLCTITALKTFGTGHPDYGDVTMLECCLRASEQIQGDAASRINVVATRKLYPLEDDGFGSAKEATSSIVDAAAYIVTSDNGGMQADSILDSSSLKYLRDVYRARGDEFNYRFTSRVSVMEACAKAAQCGRAVPYVPGGRFKLIRDAQQVGPSQLFTEDDYTEGSLSITHVIRTDDSPTCVQVYYTDSDTWQAESVYCYDVGGSTLKPAELRLEGCTSREQAWREGIYRYKDDELNRSIITFRTGLKGHIPQPGRLVVASVIDCNWGQTGRIAAIDGDDIWLTEPVAFGDPDGDGVYAGRMYVSNPSGGSPSLVTVYATDESHHVTGALSADTANTVENDGEEASRFWFGPLDEEKLLMRVARIKPAGVNDIEIQGSTIDNEVYTAEDSLACPELGSTWAEPDPVQSLAVAYQGLSDGVYQWRASWYGSADEWRVEVDQGAGYAIRADNHTSCALLFETNGNEITVKVTPYEDSELSTDDAETVSYTLPDTPTGLTLLSCASTISLDWDDDEDADNFLVAIYYDDELQMTMSADESELDITVAELEEADGPWAEWVVEVCAVIGLDSGAPASLTITPDIPGEIGGFTWSDNGDSTYDIGWDPDANADSYTLHYGTSEDFTPSAGNQLYSGPLTSYRVTAVEMTGDYTHYFKVAGKTDYWSPLSVLIFGELKVEANPTLTLPDMVNKHVTEEVVFTQHYQNIDADDMANTNVTGAALEFGVFDPADMINTNVIGEALEFGVFDPAGMANENITETTVFTA